MANGVTNTFVNGTVASATEVNTNFSEVINPIGSMMPWLKTFTSISSGNADTNTVDKLVDSGATFQSDGAVAEMVIHNSTDDTFGIAGTVESETSIALSADSGSGSAVTDVFPLGTEAYTIYATPALPAGWLECNGQTVSDASSPYDGQAIPDLNADSGTARFLRGGTSSGGTSGSETHNHQWSDTGTTDGFASQTSGFTKTDGSYNSAGANTAITESGGYITGSYYTDKISTLPSYYEVVWIMRIK
jgi:hypothetical protein